MVVISYHQNFVIHHKVHTIYLRCPCKNLLVAHVPSNIIQVANNDLRTHKVNMQHEKSLFEFYSTKDCYLSFSDIKNLGWQFF